MVAACLGETVHGLHWRASRCHVPAIQHLDWLAISGHTTEEVDITMRCLQAAAPDQKSRRQLASHIFALSMHVKLIP